MEKALRVTRYVSGYSVVLFFLVALVFTLYSCGVPGEDTLNGLTTDGNPVEESISDTIPPSSVGDLEAQMLSETSVKLSWTAPGDDGDDGTAKSYDIRYFTSLNDFNWESSTEVAGEPEPEEAGTPQSMTVSNLVPRTTYYFAMKTSDEASNTSGLSNFAIITTGSTDNTAPGSIDDLTASNATSSSIDLSWTAPGDDLDSGTASSYDVRYSTSVIDETNWDSAVKVTGEPAPKAAGTVQSMTVTGLAPGTTYYFAIKTSDEVPNVSDISNIAQLSTTAASVPIPGDPVIRYASAKNGPVSGWEGSSTRGAAITIWAENIGAYRGNSTLTVCGVTLESDSEFAEWGANTRPKTAKNTRRITFWLNSKMKGGEGIYVTVGGVRSNMYPFRCDATGNIRFVDYQNGSDENDGRTVATAWKTLNYAANQMKPGDFMYLLGGTYSEGRFNIGYWEVATDWYPGTDAERITMTSYPGEEAVVSTEIGARSSYWTFTNITFRGAGIYEPLSLGDRNGFRADSIHGISTGISAIGNEFTGTMWHAMDAYGDGIVIQGNYIEFTPDPATKNGSAYALYMCSGIDRVIRDNEIHGGAKWLIHYYDEKRTSTEVYKEVSGVIEGNWFDATDNGGIGLRGAIILEVVNNGTPPVTIEMKGVTIRNNIFFTRDRGLIEDWAMVFIRQNAKNIKIYNNTFYNINNRAIWINHSSAENIDISNNIFDAVGKYDVDAYYWNGSPKNVNVENNLYDDGPNLNSTVDTRPVTGDPKFVYPAGYDFHLQLTSPAIDKGAALGVVTRDYEYNPRPLDGDSDGVPEYDIGAFEYVDQQ